MLVFPDGSQTGTLGGGCVEAEVKRRSLFLLDDGRPEIVTFHLDDNYGWDDGLICGGRMKMLVDPVRPGDDVGYYDALSTRVAQGKGFTEAVVLDAVAIGSRTPADRWLVDENGEIVAHRGGDGRPAGLLSNVKPLSQRPRAYVSAGVSYLPRLHRSRLVIVGAGHVGQKVAELASDADFEVWIVDDREEYCNAERFPFAKRLLRSPRRNARRSRRRREDILHHRDARTPSRRRGPLAPGQEADAVYRHDRQPPENPPDFRRPVARRNSRERLARVTLLWDSKSGRRRCRKSR